MAINYEKAFKKLVEQVKTEELWALDSALEDTLDRGMYFRGMIFAYGSISKLADQLSNGTYKFEEEES